MRIAENVDREFIRLSTLNVQKFAAEEALAIIPKKAQRQEEALAIIPKKAQKIQKAIQKANKVQKTKLKKLINPRQLHDKKLLDPSLLYKTAKEMGKVAKVCHDACCDALLMANATKNFKRSMAETKKKMGYA